MIKYPAVKHRTAGLKDLRLFPVSCRISEREVLPALSPVYRGAGFDGIKKAAYCKGIESFLLFTDGGAYISGDGARFIRFSDGNERVPFALDILRDEKPCAALVSGNSVALLTADGFSGLSIAENLISGVMHCGRLFGVSADGLRVCWSKCGIDDFSKGLYGGGSLYLGTDRGEISAILEFGENLVAVRKFGLTLLGMYGSPENFAVKLTDTDTDEIIPGTAKVAGGKLYFCTKSGVCSFDGSKTVKAAHRFKDEVSVFYFAESYAGDYFLSCGTESFGRAVLCIGQDGESYLIDVEAEAMCAADGLYIYNKDGVYSLEKGGYTLIAKGVDFGTGANKTVTEIYAGGGKFDVGISNGLFTRRFCGACGAVKPKLRGRKFTVEISGREPLENLSITAEASVGI